MCTSSGEEMGDDIKWDSVGQEKKHATLQSNILCLRNVNLLKNIVQRGLCGKVPERGDIERSSWQ